MDRVRLAVVTLRVDAVANVALAVALAAGARPIADLVGLSQAWPVLLLAVLMVVNGAACWAVARRPAADRLRRLAAVDAMFVAALLAVAVLNPGDAPAAARWGMVVVADVAAAVGVVKLWCSSDARVAQAV